MPLINIKYDDAKVSDTEIKILSESIQKIVSGVTGIEDVFVYGDSAKIKVNIAPIEIFIEMSAEKIIDQDKLLSQIVTKITEWKAENKFPHQINLTLIPMNWKIKIGI